MAVLARKASSNFVHQAEQSAGARFHDVFNMEYELYFTKNAD